jgi:hypothetical protein
MHNSQDDGTTFFGRARGYSRQLTFITLRQKSIFCGITGQELSFTPCNWVLLENLAGFQLVKKFPAFYGTRRFITAVASARHLSLSSASFPYVPETYLQLSQVSFSCVPVCVRDRIRSNPPPCPYPALCGRTCCMHACTFSTFHMQWHFGEVPKPWIANRVWENLRKCYF